MSRGVELPWVVWDRRVRPFSLAIMWTTFVVGLQYAALQDGPGSVIADWFTGGFAFAAATLLMVGWATKNDTVHDWGLLIAAGVWGARSALYLLEDGPRAIGVWLSLGWFVGIFGAYLLERYDHAWKYHRAHRE